MILVIIIIATYYNNNNLFHKQYLLGYIIKINIYNIFF